MPYILPGARASYRNWWNVHSSVIELWLAYRHLNIPALGYVPRVPWKYLSCRGWVRPWSVSTSGESSFRQKNYAKKHKNQVREDWRERKGFQRDQAKTRRRGCPKWLKRQCNKDYRVLERRLIQTGKDEQLGTKLRKDFFDPWMWG